MLILHSRPADITWTIETEFLTSSDALTDSKPARATRIGFPGGFNEQVTMFASWPVPTVLRGAHIIFQGGIPAGARVRMTGKRVGDSMYTYDLGGNSVVLNARTIRQPNGTITATFIFDDDLDPVIGVTFGITDNDSGTWWGMGYIDIGEIMFGPGEEWCIRREFADRIDDPTLFEQTIGNQPHVVARQSAIERSIEIVPVDWNAAYMDQQKSLTRLRAALDHKADCVVIPALRPPATGRGPINYAVANETALFGKCTDLGQLRSIGEGARWALPLTFRESPGRLVR